MVDLFGLSTELGMRNAVELEYIYNFTKFVIQVLYLYEMQTKLKWE